MKTFEIFAKFDCKRNGKLVGVCPLINFDMQETAKVIAKSIIAMGYADDFMVREKKSGEDVTGLVQTIIDEIMEEQKTQEKEVVERYIYVTRKDGGIVKTITPEIKKKLKKILALAENGSAGEQENARNMLQELLNKYNITLDDIACDVEKNYIFRKINNKMEFDLWSQIVFKVRNVSTFKYTELKGGKYATKCTEAERIEIENQFGFHKRLFRNEYKKQLKKLQEELLTAYVNKHDIFPTRPVEKEQENQEEQQPIDLERLQRILAYQRNLSEETYYKMIENI